MHRIVVWAAVGLFVLFGMYVGYGINVPLELYRQWFGLTSTSTVADFRAASVDLQVDWLTGMCRHGACIHVIDWRCGFDNGSDYEVNDCFTKLVAKAPLAENLGKLRLICGRRNMVFIGESYSDPKQCAEAGGQWGKKTKVFSDEDSF